MKNTKHTEMNDSSIEQEKLSQSKRKILTSIGVTSTVVGASALVPSTWVKPAVNSIIIPAHAQSSPSTTAAPSTTPVATTPAATTAAPKGPKINVLGYPTSGRVGDGEKIIYHVRLSDAPTPDSQTGSTTVTIIIAAEPKASVARIESAGDTLTDTVGIEFTDMKGHQEVHVTTVDNPDDHDVTVTFTASGGGYDNVAATAEFEIVEDDNIAPTGVQAKAGKVNFNINKADVTVTWMAPDTNAAVAGYIVSSNASGVDPIRVGSPGETVAVFKELVNASTHVFSVAAVYEEGDSATASAEAITIGS